MRHLLCLILLTVFALIEFQEVFVYSSFGPEFPLFYFYTDGLSFTQMLRSYTYNELMWYRPTVHSALYWLGDQFLGWHDLLGWKLYHFTTVLATAFGIYWFVAGPLGFGVLASSLSAGFFLAQPSIFAFVMEMSGFDFVYILLALICVGTYLRGAMWATAVSWLAFLVSLTCKEVMLAMPFYLAFVSVLLVGFRKAQIRREIVRLVPFFALLPAYYVFHLARMPQDQFSGAYRLTPSWQTIAVNLKNLPLWTARIYAFTGESLDRPMYQSNWVNNSVGAVVLLLVLAAWILNTRRRPEWRLPGVLLACWIPMFLAIPIYSGGYPWHVNLAAAGYSALAGIALAWWIHRIPARALVLTLLCGGALLLARWNLNVELHDGTHATAFRINGQLLTSPPLPTSAIPPSSLIFIEDRLRMGGWWYGCFGKLFNYVYLRHDLEEVIVPPLDEIPEDLKRKWASRPNAFFFRYDSRFRWSDGSQELKAAIEGRRPQACSGTLSAPLRIDAGGLRSTDAAGRHWSGDEYFDAGQTFATQQSIAGTDVPEVYQTERFHAGPFEYRFCLADGDYNVVLRFAEIWFDAPGRRVFRVLINGAPVLDRFDILQQAGGANRALDRTFAAKSVNGELRVRFEPIVSNPKINAIEISR